MLEESSTISFRAKLLRLGSRTLLRLPESASAKLPSRGMVMIEGTINGFHFKAPLEPDGNRGHWLNVEKDMLRAAKADTGDTVTLEIGVSRDWPEPEMPDDLEGVLKNSEKAHRTWEDTTPAAHWDWIRWIRSTKNPETREEEDRGRALQARGRDAKAVLLQPQRMQRSRGVKQRRAFGVGQISNPATKTNRAINRQDKSDL